MASSVAGEGIAVVVAVVAVTDVDDGAVRPAHPAGGRMETRAELVECYGTKRWKRQGDGLPLESSEAKRGGGRLDAQRGRCLVACLDGRRGDE